MHDDERSSENLTKKIVTLGLGAYFLTEDAIRRYVKDAKIPRDVARTITQNAAKGKEELYGFVARELSGFLRQMDLQRELGAFVRKHKVRVSAEIEFVPREDEPARAEDEGGERTRRRSGPIEWNVSVKSTPPGGEPAAD